jgi:hypothetical protein
MSDNIVPFERRRTGRPPQRTPARELAAQQSLGARAKYDQARTRQESERLLREGTPVPARITMALDLGGHDGPEVDTACGAAEPAVDLWECGVEQPNAEQVKLLSALTGFPVGYFYLPIEPGPLIDGMWICWADKRGCQRLEPDYVDERGVLHYGGEPPRTPPTTAQGALF